MRVLVDTNILLRMADPQHVQCGTAVTAVKSLRRDAHMPCMAPQNLYEFWVAATRPPSANGLGKEPAEVEAELFRLRQSFRLLTDVPEVFDEWLKLVTRYQCIGKPAHDARLVAAMLVHGVTHL